MNEEFKFEKGSFLHIKSNGRLEVSTLKPGGWRHIRPIINFNGTMTNYVPRDGKNFENLAANRYQLLYSKSN
jgi:hypothetical protein